MNRKLSGLLGAALVASLAAVPVAEPSGPSISRPAATHFTGWPSPAVAWIAGLFGGWAAQGAGMTRAAYGYPDTGPCIDPNGRPAPCNPSGTVTCIGPTGKPTPCTPGG